MDLNEAFYFSKWDEFHVYSLNTCSILIIKNPYLNLFLVKKFLKLDFIQ